MSETTEDHLGMTDEQWARFQEYTHGYGEQDENGVDLSLLRENLKLTPTERAEGTQPVRIQTSRGAVTLAEPHTEHLRIPSVFGVRFVVVGDVALRLHGGDILSSDLDVLYDRSASNLGAVDRALSALAPRFRCSALNSDVPWNAATLFAGWNFFLRTDVGYLDLLASVPGIDSFEGIWQRSVPMDVMRVTVHVARVDDLIAMKQAANRPKDQAHLFELRALKKMIPEQHT